MKYETISAAEACLRLLRAGITSSAEINTILSALFGGVECSETVEYLLNGKHISTDEERIKFNIL